jgi:hypothetical protein
LPVHVECAASQQLLDGEIDDFEDRRPRVRHCGRHEVENVIPSVYFIDRTSKGLSGASADAPAERDPTSGEEGKPAPIATPPPIAAFPDVWFATRELSLRMLRIRDHDDRGELAVAVSVVTFKGSEQSLEIPLSGIEGIHMRRQQSDWPLWVPVAVLAGIGVLTWSQLLSLLAAVAAWLFVKWRPWVVLRYRAADGGSNEVWLADPSGSDATQRLHDAIAARLPPRS